MGRRPAGGGGQQAAGTSPGPPASRTLRRVSAGVPGPPEALPERLPRSSRRRPHRNSGRLWLSLTITPGEERVGEGWRRQTGGVARPPIKTSPLQTPYIVPFMKVAIKAKL